MMRRPDHLVMILGHTKERDANQWRLGRFEPALLIIREIPRQRGFLFTLWHCGPVFFRDREVDLRMNALGWCGSNDVETRSENRMAPNDLVPGSFKCRDVQILSE